MRIGYDAKRLFHNRRGLGNYSRSLVGAIGDNYPDAECFLYTPSDPQDSLGKDFRQMPFHIRTSGAMFSSYWRTRGILQDIEEDKLDVYHGLSHELPFGIEKLNLKSIVTVHDIIFYHYPEYFNLIDRKIYKAKLKYALKAADIVHCISRSTAEDVQEIYEVPMDKIRIIPPILDERFLLDEIPEKPRGLPDSYFLYVGALTERKNLVRLVNGWGASETETELVFVGNGSIEGEIKVAAHELEKREKVHFYEDVGHRDLPAYYAHARCLIYVSEYEGFGLPLMEAAATGCPVITSEVSSMPEVLGDASILVNPMKIESISNGIRQLERMNQSEIATLVKNAYNKIQDYRGEFVSKKIWEELYH